MLNTWIFTIFVLFFCMTYTSIQRICQKAVWSIDHTALNVASPLRRHGGEVVGEKRGRFFEPETEPWLLRGSFLSDQQGPAHRMVRYGGCACGAAVRWAW
jgi:hypothetical protein